MIVLLSSMKQFRISLDVVKSNYNINILTFFYKLVERRTMVTKEQ